MSTNERSMSENAGAGSVMPESSLLFLLPEDIELDPVVEIRGMGDNDLTDEELRQSLRENGQVQAVKVRPNDTGGFKLVAGHRRREQINLINLEAEAGTEPMKVMCIVSEMDDTKALMEACAENLQRKNLNAMQEAKLITKVRDQFNWKGGKNSKKVALFLGKSPAWVTEREKLLKLDEATQDKIAAGVLSGNAALVLPAVEADKVDEVIAEAKELQMAENVKKGTKVKVTDGKVQPLQAKHVKAAARKKKALKEGEFKALTKVEVLDVFAGYRNSIPHLYGPVQEFVIYLIDKFATGKGSIRTMESKFEAMIAPACKGAKCEPEAEEVKPVKKAKAVKPVKVAKPKAAKPAVKKLARKPSKKAPIAEIVA